MQQELTCNQVSALLSFYIEGKLNEKLKQYVEFHLNICPKCREKYKNLKNIFNKTIRNQNNSKEISDDDNQFITKQYKEFKNNLSAYIDNELEDEENMKIKKITISNPLARQDLEEIYTYKKLLYNAFEKTRNDFKDDYTKSVIDNIAKQTIQYKSDPFIKIITAFALTIIVLILGLAWLTMESGLF